MRISPQIPENKQSVVILGEDRNNPSFKGSLINTALSLSGNGMQWIENQGFWASFVIQDTLGMTLPRTVAGFMRDKDVTGKYNTQEGFEVLGREGLTGPCMMAVAPLSFLLASKFGKSTSVNSALIKRFGSSLKTFLSDSNFKKELLNNKTEFKEEFLKRNIEEILTNTFGKEKYSSDTVKYILDNIKTYEAKTSNRKARKKAMTNISEHINSLLYKSTDELGRLNKVKVGSMNLKNIQEHDICSTIDALLKYSNEAIIDNKNFSKLNSDMAEVLKDKAIARRFITNISTMGATLGVLSVLPKIYARSSIAPGAKTAMALREQQSQKESSKEHSVSFKGKEKPSKSFLERIGKTLDKYTDKEFVTKELEYNGHNFTNSLMAGLSLFGLLTPRGLRAYERAQKDENGKKDLSELYEILIRDVTSSLAVVFAVPMLTRACVTSYENKTGFVLMNKNRTKSGWKTVLDLFNPYSKTHVLTNSEIKTLYNGVDSSEKMLNFCSYIDKNNGDLEKILSKSEKVAELEKKGLNLKEIAKLDKKEKNKQITNFFKELGTQADELVKTVMTTGKKPKNNAILSFARGLNSLPGIIATVLISPYILGWCIPRLTYANTRKMHEKAEQEKLNNLV